MTVVKKAIQERIYKLKLVLVASSLISIGLLLSIISDWLESIDAMQIVVAASSNLADALFVTGAIGLAIDYFTNKEKIAADLERTRRVLKELTPEFVDAVIDGFRVNRTDLQRVSTPELLDEIATNVLSMRLGDDQFAREIY